MAQIELPPGVPDFEAFVKQRQAEIHTRKEKKRGGIPFWPNFAAVKGLGASAQLGVAFASKIGLMVTFGAIASLAGAGGLWHRAQLQRRAEEFKKKQFETSLVRETMLNRKGPSSMSSALPTVDGARNDTVGFVKAGELAGPNAADAAAAAAAAGAKEGDGANGADGAGKGDGQQAAQDPNAMAAEMMAQAGAQAGAGAKGGAGAAGSGGFGKLSSGLGGMRGGGGMSGGVGRGFDQKQMSNTMLAKAQAMRGGNDPSITSRRGRTGKARNWMGNRNITSGARSAASANKLRQMAADMNANKNADVSKANTANTAAWENANAPSAQVANPPAIGPTSQSGGSFGGPQDSGEGGPVISSPDPGDIDTGANVPTVPAFENVTPYQWAVDLAKMLCILIVVLALISAIFQGKAWFEAIHAYIVGIIAALGGILALLGVYMIAMGQYWQGTMYTILGGVVAIVALATPTSVSYTTLGVTAGLAGVIGAIFAKTANEGDNEDDEEQHKKDYEKKYGVKWDNNRDVINHEKWDKRYGKDSAENYEKQGEFDDMR